MSIAVPLASAVLVALVAGLSGVSVRATVTQDARSGEMKTVWDGVYTVEQAARGRDAYEHSCARCHNTGEGPTLVGEALVRNWFEDGLNVPFTKMRTTMPADEPGSLSPQIYVDVLSFLLQASGVPAGPEALTPDPERLASILVVDRGGPGGPVPNFSLVQVVGCLTQDAEGVWRLTNSTEPVRTREPGESASADLQVSAARPLGAHALQLLDVPVQRRNLKGHKVQAKGLLIRHPNGDRLNLTSLQSVAETCAE